MRTIVTSGERREARARASRWGADVAVNHDDGDVVAAVKEATGTGVDVVVETVGEATWARSLAAVRPFGRVVVCGATSGPNPPAAAPPVLVEAARPCWGRRWAPGTTFSAHTTSCAAAAPGCTSTRVYPLAEIAAAHERLEAGEQLGKIVLVIPGAGS